ncbi:MAG: Maf family protein [Proteobacteria bacterium]|nr:Maf family protein [Pseudomonadota bacterium]
MIILASTSKYRKKLMTDAGFTAECVAPLYEEQSIPGMHPLDLIAYHARNKALSVAASHPDDIVIGSDQGLVDGDVLLGKPGSVENACVQLEGLRGHAAILATSLVVVHGSEVLEYQDRAILHFRDNLSSEVIRAYVLADMPLDCAGSFKIESRGPRLFSSIECHDPTAIQGLPMMKLTEMLVQLDPSLDERF